MLNYSSLTRRGLMGNLAVGASALAMGGGLLLPRRALAAPNWPDPILVGSIPSGDYTYVNSNNGKTFANLRSVIQGSPAGEHVVVIGSFTGDGQPITISQAATEDRPLVIRGSYDGTDETQFPEIVNAVFEVGSTASRVIFWKLRLKNCLINLGGTENRVARCRFYGNTSRIGIDTPGNSFRCRIDHNRFGERNGVQTTERSISLEWAGAPPVDWSIDRNVFEKFGSDVAAIFVGLGVGTTDDATRIEIVENLFKDRNQADAGAWIETKATDVRVRRNTFRRSTSSFKVGSIRLRHGNGHRVEGNLFVADYSGGDAGFISVRDGPNSGEVPTYVINNWSVSRSSASSTAWTPAGGNVELYRGNSDYTGWPGNKSQGDQINSGKAEVGGNHMGVACGSVPAGSTGSVAATGHRIGPEAPESCPATGTSLSANCGVETPSGFCRNPQVNATITGANYSLKPVEVTTAIAGITGA